MIEKAETSFSHKIIVNKRRYEKEPRPIIELIHEWNIAYKSGSLMKLGRKNEPTNWFDFSESKTDRDSFKTPVDGVLSLQDMPESLSYKLSTFPVILAQHCAPNPSVSHNLELLPDLLHGDIVIEDFSGQQINNPLLQAIVKKMGIKIEDVSKETVNSSIEISDNKSLKVDPLLSLVTTPKLNEYIHKLLGSQINVVEELANSKFRENLWGILYLVYKHQFFAGEYATEFGYDEETHQSISYINPDIFTPTYKHSGTNFGGKLKDFGLGQLDVNMSYQEFEEGLKDSLGIPATQRDIDWDQILKKYRSDVRIFTDKYPYFKLGLKFLVHPVIYKTDSILYFKDLSRNLNKALGELNNTSFGPLLQIPDDAKQLHDIDGVPNYEISDGTNMVGVSISRSSGYCKLHSPFSK